LTRHWAVIPVKGVTESKRRLSNYLGDNKRRLVEALLQDVLSSVIRANVFDTVMLISPDENVEALARSNRVSFVRQTGLGLNRAIEQANRLAVRENVRSLTSILADIPLAEPRDFVEIFEMQRTSRCAVLAPSSKGGTNVMLDRPPGIVRPSYGRWSYSKHLRQAQLGGLDVYSMSNSRVSFDVDTINDLVELRRRDPDAKTGSARVVRDLRPLLSQARFA
jgi:2-phospho-L-lactate/phosphoenolpyruvate guanylyltransferase